MTQFSFVFNPAANGAETWEHELAALSDAVTFLTVKEVAYQLDVSKSAIDDALKERKNDNGTEKRWASKWTHVVIAMLVQRNDPRGNDILERLLEAPTLGTRYILDEADHSDQQVEAAQAIVDGARRRKDRAAKRGSRKRAA